LAQKLQLDIIEKAMNGGSMLLQSQKISLRPLTTAHLAQTMTLLSLTNGELRQKIESALASNPALDLLEQARCPHCHRPVPPSRACPYCSAPKKPGLDEPIVFVSTRQEFAARANYAYADEMPSEEWTAAEEDLPTYVLRQIAPDLAPEDRVLAAHILTSLNDDGLLSIPLIEIATYHHVLVSQVKNVQRLIQRSDPLGVGSSTPQEALKVQLEVLGETRPIPPLAKKLVDEGMDLLSRRAYTELSRMLHVSTNQVKKLAAFIGENLNPFPARAHWGDFQQNNEGVPTYQEPDVIITQMTDLPGSPLVVEVLSPYAGSLRISPLFREAIQQAPPEKAQEWQSELEEAILLVKCLQQRNNTMVRLMRRLASIQRQFILRGDAFLKPITRAQLAVELEVHESTISRAVSGKAVQLPNKKIIPLSKLFDRSLNIRTALIRIISDEEEPLSDTQIAERLEEQGYNIARRTVAKYRSIEGILPARLRQPTPALNHE
jgi:RNA polymerase sigma-54 factor